MDRKDYTDDDYSAPHVPPATPPVVDSAADPDDARTLPDGGGDSASPGKRPAHLDREREDRNLQSGNYPAAHPDEVEPGTPDEIGGDGGDTVEPGATPDETHPVAPDRIVPPPD